MSDPENSPSTTGTDLGGGGAGALWLLFEKRQEIRTAPGDRLQTNGHFGKDGLQEKGHVAPERAPHFLLPSDSVFVQQL